MDRLMKRRLDDYITREPLPVDNLADFIQEYTPYKHTQYYIECDCAVVIGSTREWAIEGATRRGFKVIRGRVTCPNCRDE